MDKYRSTALMCLTVTQIVSLGLIAFLLDRGYSPLISFIHIPITIWYLVLASTVLR